jgi:hypothetical protein
VEDAVEADWKCFEAVQTQASGIFGSPVGAQWQVRKTGFWIKCSLFVMVPPLAVRA